MVSVQFHGDGTDIDKAEAWCQWAVNEGYFMRSTGASEYEFQFLCPYEAQRFRDRYRDQTSRLLFDERAW